MSRKSRVRRNSFRRGADSARAGRGGVARVGKPPLTARVMGAIWYWALAALAATWRKRIVGSDHLDRLIARGGPSVAAFWHGEYLTLLAALYGRPVVVFTSATSRGAIIAAISRRAGMSVHEIPHSGRGRSYAIMRHAVSGGGMAVVAVDGPLGPYHVVKPGAARLASELGCPIVPIACAVSRSARIPFRWDKMRIPWPFARVAVVCGEPMRAASPAELHRRLDSLETEAEALIGRE